MQIVFFLQILWLFWTLPVLTGMDLPSGGGPRVKSLYTHWNRGNCRERLQSLGYMLFYKHIYMLFHRKQKTELLIIPSKNFLKCFPKRSWLLIEAPPLIRSVMVVFVKPFLWKRFVKIWAVQGRERWTIPPFKPLSGLPAPSPPPLPILSCPSPPFPLPLLFLTLPLLLPSAYNWYSILHKGKLPK